MKSSKKKPLPKYTIGPCGEIYNNYPVLSERSRQIMEMMALKGMVEQIMSKEDKEDDVEGTAETDSKELHN